MSNSVLSERVFLCHSSSEYLWQRTIAIGVEDALGNIYRLPAEVTEGPATEATQPPLRVNLFRHKESGEIITMAYLHRRDNVSVVPTAG